jgi:hypothetical protein
LLVLTPRLLQAVLVVIQVTSQAVAVVAVLHTVLVV